MEEFFENLKTNLQITNNHEKLVTLDAKQSIEYGKMSLALRMAKHSQG